MLRYRLALRMGRTVSELTSTMTSDEWAHWLAFDRHSPFGDERIDVLMAQLCVVVANSAGSKKRGGGTFGIEDFLIYKPFRKEREAIDVMTSWFGDRIVKTKVTP